MIGRLISEISCDEHEFEKAKGDYNKLHEKKDFRLNFLNFPSKKCKKAASFRKCVFLCKYQIFVCDHSR